MSDVVTCECGQKNRLPAQLMVGQVARCGRCKTLLAQGDESPLDMVEDEDGLEDDELGEEDE
jgi:uncharacterized paraquat-inducible protein A